MWRLNMDIKVTQERQEVLDDWNVKYKIVENNGEFFFVFNCPKEKDKAFAVLSAALEI